MDKDLQRIGFSKVDYSFWHNAQKKLSISYDFKTHSYRLFSASAPTDLSGTQICTSESLQGLIRYIKTRYQK